MKSFLKIFLKYYLKLFTKLVLWVRRPEVIAVAGSVNKSFVRDEIKKVLEESGFSVRANPKNFNTEIGLPLSILGLPSGYNSYRAWLPAIFSAPKKVFQKNFPQFLVLELGVSRRSDMRYLLSLVRPKICVITELTQRYVESFSGMDDLAEEYKLLIKKISPEGLVVLNGDNRRLRELAKFSRAKTVFFGQAEDSFGRATEIEKDFSGQKFKMILDGRESGERTGRFGRHHIFSRLASEIVGNFIKSNSKKWQ